MEYVKIAVEPSVAQGAHRYSSRLPARVIGSKIKILNIFPYKSVPIQLRISKPS